MLKKDATRDDNTPSMIPNLDYKPPPWAVEPSSEYTYGVDVIKNGVLVESIDFNHRAASTYIVVGRLPICDIHLDHPSISRSLFVGFTSQNFISVVVNQLASLI